MVSPKYTYTFIPGEDGDHHAGDRLDIYRRLGRYARIIHAIPLDEAGQQHFNFEVRTLEILHDAIRYIIGALGPEDELVRLGVYDVADRDAIAQVFDGLLTIDFRFGLCHGDLSPRNILIDAAGQQYLIDWGCAMWTAVPHRDYYELYVDMLCSGDVNPAVLQAFADGYGLAPAAYRQLLVEAEGFLLFKSFDLVHWAMARKPARTTAVAQRARRVWELVKGSE